MPTLENKVNRIIAQVPEEDEYKNRYDVVVVGAGPAGLSTAIYLARAKYKVLVLEKDSVGGAITITQTVENYPGIAMTSGKSLTADMRLQAERFGARIIGAEVTSLDLDEDVKVVHTDRGDYRCLGVVLAVGARPRLAGFRGEKECRGLGVSYNATGDGELFEGKELLVVGGGFAAVEESIFLTRYAKKVTILVRGDCFTCAQTVVDNLKNYPQINVLYNTEITETRGDGKGILFATLRNRQTGELADYRTEDGQTFGVFVFAGYVPHTEWIGSGVELDQKGFIITDNNQKTNIDGVYAAGDVCIKTLRQVVTAVADGAIAATALEKYCTDMHHKLGIPDLIKQ